ncbi:2Fe-2S iron-sulfur cluster-binding protein [Phenylobacterium montanum]|uniref:2Fe-2S iron-sulfur cluster binding domain-containing protein n=1 Tax=Phenylobacterium montanum TaxID=2823693 RepID=A0A975G4W4_9CAUL|nr:2Fe-2S iron-sulfur cluster-binding protein [Caulobacter sp. S6]QUD90638.1 2Fe-2S iron-sulfur cluster binding domain-containing protein [Caulobacter sp. S6]
MAKIRFIQPDGTEQSIEATPGRSVMEAAVGSAVSGVDADCGGACACATCHVYVDHEWRDRLPDIGAMEASMLEFAQGVGPDSRLSCQIKVNDALDGLVIRLPLRQH